jgi:capsular polysaccharide biosynthesis protein
MKKIFFHCAKILNLSGKPIFIENIGNVCCENLFFTSFLHHPLNRIDPQLVHYYQEAAHNVVSGNKGYERRVFIDRADGSRGLVNREEVNLLLTKYNFETVNFDNMDIQQQLQILHSSNVIAGIHGAGFANLVFAKLTQKISCIEIIPKLFGMQSYWFLANGLGINYYPVWPINGWGDTKVSHTKFENIDVDLSSFETSIKLAIKKL